MLQDKKIIVTGGLGFIGSHYVELLLDNCVNCEIIIIDKVTYCVSDKTLPYLKERAKTSKCDLKFIKECICTYKVPYDVHYVVNFAAESHVDKSINDGSEFIESNINGVYNLLEQLDPLTRFVQISTDEVYGSLSKKSKSSTESDLLKPSSIYSSSKASADLIALSFFKTHNKDVVITRCTNNFGPRQYIEKFIPNSIGSALNDKYIIVYGTGKNIRQWIHVKDHCKQIYKVMIRGNSGEIYNISPSYRENTELSNIYIAKKIKSIIGKGDICKVDDRLGHDFRYSLNGSKTRKLDPCIHQLELFEFNVFDNDLRDTILWYKNNLNYWNK